MTVAIIYDIKNNTKRTKLANELFRYGIRVQKSVFEADITKKEYSKLQDIAYKYSDDEDKVSIYEILSTKRFGDIEYIENFDLIY